MEGKVGLDAEWVVGHVAADWRAASKQRAEVDGGRGVELERDPAGGGEVVGGDGEASLKGWSDRRGCRVTVAVTVLVVVVVVAVVVVVVLVVS